MTNYENDIIKLLEGETPREKYLTLRELIQVQKDYKDLVIKLKRVAKEPLVSEQLNKCYIIINKL